MQKMSYPLTTSSKGNVPGPVVLQTFDLTRAYGANVVVDHINLTARRGEILGFLGANGAGKTTTIRMILSLVSPTAGRVELFGQDVARHSVEVLPRVGALIEMPALYLHVTARQNLRAFGTLFGGVSERQIDALLDLLDLRAAEKKRVRTFSLGMKQRLGIAIALLNDPDLLLLDEPTNGLDPLGVIEMRDLLRRLADSGKAIIISSHILAEMQQICSRVAIIKRGRLVKEAPVEELISQSSQHELSIRVDRPEEALLLLRAQPWGKSARLSDGMLITGAPNDQPAALARFLIQAGFVAETIMPHEANLEKIFLDLTSDQSGER